MGKFIIQAHFDVDGTEFVFDKDLERSYGRSIFFRCVDNCREVVIPKVTDGEVMNVTIYPNPYVILSEGTYDVVTHHDVMGMPRITVSRLIVGNSANMQIGQMSGIEAMDYAAPEYLKYIKDLQDTYRIFNQPTVVAWWQKQIGVNSPSLPGLFQLANGLQFIHDTEDTVVHDITL